MEAEPHCFVRPQSTGDVYYRVRFSGSEVINFFQVMRNCDVLFSGKADPPGQFS